MNFYFQFYYKNYNIYSINNLRFEKLNTSLHYKIISFVKYYIILCSMIKQRLVTYRKKKKKNQAKPKDYSSKKKKQRLVKNVNKLKL